MYICIYTYTYIGLNGLADTAVSEHATVFLDSRTLRLPCGQCVLLYHNTICYIILYYYAVLDYINHTNYIVL